MSVTPSVLLPALLLAAVLVSACDDRSPSAPSPIPPAVPSSSSATPDLSLLVGVWNLTLRLTEVTGDGCLAEAMQSQIGVLNRYALSVQQASGSTLNVTLSSASGNYSCTFTNVPADSSGFTTGWHRRFLTLSCLWEVVLRDFRCGDGTLDLMSWSQDISARVSADEISGQWRAAFSDGPPYLGTTWAETEAEFSGSR